MRLQVTPNWYSLGLELGLTQHALDVIEEDSDKHSNAFKRKMFSKWLLSSNDASYTSLVDALVAIDNKDVAENVSQQFCKFNSLLNAQVYYMGSTFFCISVVFMVNLSSQNLILEYHNLVLNALISVHATSLH